MSEAKIPSSLLELAQKIFENRFPSFTPAEIGVLKGNSRLEELSEDSNERGIQAGATDASGDVGRDDNLVDRRLVEWLATDAQAAACIPRTGLHIRGAVIGGGIDLSYADIAFPLEFTECVIRGPLVISQARIRGLRLIGTKITELNASGCVIDGDLQLSHGFQTEGPVLLRNASVAGTVDCTAASFMNDDSVAFLGDGLRVQGDLGFCGGFRAKGEMRLIGAVIGGDLVCAKAGFSNPDKIAFMADRARIGGAAIFGEGFTATGETRLVGAAVNRDLIFDGAQLSNPGGKALNAEHLDVGGSLRLRNGFLAEGEVSLLRSVISKSLDCSRGAFRNLHGNAISADGIVVHDVYFALGFEAHGPVRILGAKVSGDVACIAGTFNDPDGIALGADCAQIEGSLFLRDATMHGEVRLLGARIGANLERMFPCPKSKKPFLIRVYTFLELYCAH